MLELKNSAEAYLDTASGMPKVKLDFSFKGYVAKIAYLDKEACS
jgi:hypothetical protein